jgi:O-antigen ligase
MRILSNDAVSHLSLLALWSLPVIGLVAGPTYAAIIFGLGCVYLLRSLIIERIFPRFDFPISFIAATFLLLCWGSYEWSISPTRTARGAGQLTAIFLGALAMLSYQPPSQRNAHLLIRGMQLALIPGAVIIFSDAVSGYELQSLLTSGLSPPTKYNRGIDYLLVVSWPLLGYSVARREWRMAIAVPALVCVIVISGHSSTAMASGLAGSAVFAAAVTMPRMILPALALTTSAVGAALPFALLWLTEHRALLISHIKPSLFHRLEIWDYTTARVLERPFVGWGFASANTLPIGSDELARYKYVSADGIYPHNQWLECWAEVGGVGAILLVVFCLLILRRIRRTLQPQMQPFGYAAFAAAMTTSLVGFELTTDSWWAALTACCFLLRVAGTPQAMQPDQLVHERHRGSDPDRVDG